MAPSLQAAQVALEKGKLCQLLGNRLEKRPEIELLLQRNLISVTDIEALEAFLATITPAEREQLMLLAGNEEEEEEEETEQPHTM